jgi:nucleoside-diphosphate-sugar epimerase
MPAGTAYCWAHVEDIARAHVLAMELGRPGESYIVAGPPYTFVDALRLAEQLSGVPAPRLVLGPGMLKAMAALAGIVEGLVPLPPLFAAENLRISAGVTYLGDNAKARRELGYRPRPLEEGLPEVLRHEMRLLGMPLPPRLQTNRRE